MIRTAILGVLAAFTLFAFGAQGTKFYLNYKAPDALGMVILQQEENYRAKYKAWFQACDYTDYSCIGVKVPKVVSEYMGRNLLGYYNGTDTVYVNSTLKGQRLNEVLMHEMVHYLQSKVGGLQVPGYAEPICHAENEAFSVVDQWLADHGYADLQRGSEWWVPYRHCYPWYNPNYSSSDDQRDWFWYTGPQTD